jgi:hypothetical protein
MYFRVGVALLLLGTPVWAGGVLEAAQELATVAEAPERTDTLLLRRRAEAEREYVAALGAATESKARTRAMEQWCRKLSDLGVPKGDLRTSLISKVKDMARIDFYAAYDGLLGSTFKVEEIKEMLAEFPSEQREAMLKLARYAPQKYMNKDTPYPDGVPLPGHGWGDLSRSNVAAAPAAKPAPAAWTPAYRPGQFFLDAQGSVWAVLTKVDPAQRRYFLLSRKYYPKREPYYLYAEESGNWGFQELWFDESNARKLIPTPTKYTACESCGGEGCQYDDVTRVRGGKWEEVSSVVKVYTPQRVTSSYQRKVTCRGCGGAGWKKL